MTSVGHTLLGMTLRNLAAPRTRSRYLACAQIAAFAAVANLPDWPFPGWGHGAYHVSHSVFVLSLIVIILTPAGIFLLRKFYPYRFAAWVWAGLGAALLSHIFLDTLYCDGAGLACLWPVSDVRCRIPFPLFRYIRVHEGISIHNLRVCAIEALFYGTIFAASILGRRKIIPCISKEAAGKIG